MTSRSMPAGTSISLSLLFFYSTQMLSIRMASITSSKQRPLESVFLDQTSPPASRPLGSTVDWTIPPGYLASIYVQLVPN